MRGLVAALLFAVGRPNGNALLLMGPSGSGKTTLFLQVIMSIAAVLVRCRRAVVPIFLKGTIWEGGWSLLGMVAKAC